jgi:chemotaxis signal transduction protein
LAGERTNAKDDRAGKYLVFQLGREEFGIRVLRVRENMGSKTARAVPQQPAHVKGVINLRDMVIPAVDLRLKFGLPAVEYYLHHRRSVARQRELSAARDVGG